MAKRTPLERIMARVVEAPGPLDTDCWIWQGASNGRYGVMSTLSGSRLCHRIVYEATVGSIPDGLHLDHLCRIPLCVNPAHLEAVTPRENLLRGAGVGPDAVRSGTCKRGHSLEDAYRLAKGRKCRTCQKLYQAGQLPDVIKRGPRA
jgi:hypothetical protein